MHGKKVFNDQISTGHMCSVVYSGYNNNNNCSGCEKT